MWMELNATCLTLLVNTNSISFYSNLRNPKEPSSVLVLRDEHPSPSFSRNLVLQVAIKHFYGHFKQKIIYSDGPTSK